MSNTNEDILQKLAPSIVEIIAGKEEDLTTLGTGFVVTDDGLVVTCRHVIADSQDKIMKSVSLRFHSDGKTGVKFTARPVREDKDFKDDPSIDIAFLRLDKLPEKGVTAVKLDDKVVSLNNFATIGFKKAEEFTGLSARGEIRIRTHIKNSNGSIISPEVIELYSSNQIEPGMSGAPVLDLERNRVVGIITERYIDQYNQGMSNVAFALPIEAVLNIRHDLREKNYGLTLISKFLHAIGEEGSSIYKWIDDVYVPPIEYEDIKESLKSNRVVFITGTKEFGKTFTAVKLMYEFFREANNKGYKPRWIRARREPAHEGADPKELLKLIEKDDYIKPHEIVYFEDPFGRTEYERSSDLEDYIGSIIDRIRNIPDTYVIITSREELFKKFQMHQRSSLDFEKFEKRMNLKKTSYDTEKRKNILLNWAKISNCKWLLDSDLKELVLEAIENQRLLPTPLNIKEFVIASHDILERKEILRLMKQKSEETAKRFAHEIIRMGEDQILFLALVYISSSSLNVGFVKKMYESIIIDNTELSQNHTNFESVRKWFEGDKVNISEWKIAFSHPSYHEAFRFAIDGETHDNARIRYMLSKSLSKLVYQEQSVLLVARRVAENFHSLPAAVQEILFKLVDSNRATEYNIPWFRAAKYAAYAIAENFNNLPPNVQQLLFKLADSPDSAWYVANTVSTNFNNLPPNVREELLFKLAGDDKAAWYAAYAIAENFNNLPPNVREELLLKLADNDDAAMYVAKAVTANFDKLRPNIQQIIFRLVDNDKAAEHVAIGILRHFNNFSPNTREKLLLKLAGKDQAAGYVAYAITNNFDKLPPHIQQLLFKLADKHSMKAVVSSAIKHNSKNIPENIRKELLTKLEKSVA